MKNLFILLTVFLLSFGCQEDNKILNPQDDQLYKEFTLSGSAEGFTTFPYGETNPFRHFDGEGQSNLGNVQLALDYIMTSLDPITLTGTSGFGSGELIMANGSKINAIHGQGTFAIVGTIVTFSATAVIAGGTGDYDNVKGTLNYSGTIDQTNRATQVEWTGSFTRERPFLGSGVGETQSVNGSCSTGFVRRNIEGSGNATHIGNATFLLEHCINPQTGIIMDGTGTVISSSGDKFFITDYGYGLPVPGTNTAAVNLFATITGGDGKFEGASGYIWLKGIQEMPAGQVTATFDGVIDY